MSANAISAAVRTTKMVCDRRCRTNVPTMDSLPCALALPLRLVGKGYGWGPEVAHAWRVIALPFPNPSPAREVEAEGRFI
jgi:hypothetical protein